VLRDARLAFRLDAARPVWEQWTGPVPEFNPELPRTARADIEAAAREIGEPPRAQSSQRSFRQRIGLGTPPPETTAPDWRQQAWQAEREGRYDAAAQLYSQNKEPLRAARMWERHAEEGTGS